MMEAQKQKLGPRQQAWVDALRSGKYQQGQRRLRTINNKFCCLGVACDLWCSKSWIQLGEFYTIGGWDAVMPETVKVYYGFHDDLGEFIRPFTLGDGVIYKSLAELNDERKLSFERIADVIEADPANVFKEEK